MFSYLLGIPAGILSAFLAASSPSMGEQGGVELATRLTSGNREVQGVAIVSSIVAGQVLGTVTQVLSSKQSNSIASLEDQDVEELDVKPAKLVMYIVQQKAWAMCSGIAIGYIMSSMVKSNTTLTLCASLICVGGAGSIKKSVGIIAGLCISKIALLALSSITLNPISAMVIGLFFLPTQIIELLFGKEKQITKQSINENVPAFNLANFKDVMNVQLPAISTGSCTIVTSFIEGLGLGSKLDSNSLMIGKSTIQAIMPDSGNYILTALITLGISIPLVSTVFSLVSKWCYTNPKILSILGIVVNSLFLISFVGLGYATLITIIGLVAKTVIPAGFMRIIFFGGML